MTRRWTRVTGVVCGAAVAAATLAAPAGAEDSDGPAAAAGGPAVEVPASGARDAGGAGRLSSGESAVLDRGALRVSGADGTPSGPYSFARVGGRTEVTPTGRRTPQSTTPLATTGTATGAAPSAVTAGVQRVKIDLVNTYHFGGLIHVWDRNTWQYHDVREEQFDDFGTVDLPAGDYLVIGLYSNWQQPSHMLAKTFTVGATATTVTLDARLSKPARVAVDDPTATRQSAVAWYSLPNNRDLVGFAGGDGNPIYVTPLSLTGLTLNLHEVIGRKGSTENRPSPYRYDVLQRFRNGTPADPVAQVRTADLARTRTTVRAPGAGLTAQLSVTPRTGEWTGVYVPGPIPTGGTFTHYITPGLPYGRILAHGGQDAHLPDLAATSGPTELPAETYGHAPFGVNGGRYPVSSWNRGTFRLREHGPINGTGGVYGTDHNARHTFEVTAEGRHLGSSGVLSSFDSYQLPVDSYATYGIRHTVTRESFPSRLSPRVTTDWLISSSNLNPYDSTGLPVVDVTVGVPTLDLHNRAAAGPVAVHVDVKNRLASLTATLGSVEYSFDDGATWHTAPVSGDGGASGTATVDVPADAAFVSLRVSGTDNNGGRVTQTLTRAFAGPAPATALRSGALAVSGVTVNNGSALIAPQTGTATFPARFVVNSATGIESAAVTLHHGGYDRPDGLLHAPASCTRRSTTTYYDCTTQFTVSGPGLGLNKLVGTWSAGVFVQGTDRAAQYQGPAPAGGILIRRASALALASVTPQPVTRGGTLTVTGRLTGAAWEYGAQNGLAGQKVELQFKKAGTGTTWSVVATGLTGSTGSVSLKRAAWNDGSWRLVYGGSATSTWAPSPADYVDVR
ncbi:hypothetical protein ACFY7C_36245 [Streptomyces sp. NPDC012769]|uniref:hypothetical protein n=1 Tax=Streptomyces sp. NPDC012769 TaxID=3364848 RepID=UPI0036B3E467